MKIFGQILAASVSARISISVGSNNEVNYSGGPVLERPAVQPTRRPAAPSSSDRDRFMLVSGPESENGESNRLTGESGCCEKIIIHDLMNGQRVFEKSPFEETWLDRGGDAIFFNPQFQIWQLVPQSDPSSLGTAFTSNPASLAPGCPDHFPWLVSNDHRWSTVKKYAQCVEDTTNEDKLAYDLSERVCQIMQTAVPSLRARKIATLCQRAKSIAERVIKQRSCAAALLTRVDSNLVLSLETLREWRDKMMAINAQRNEDCENNEDLDGTIGRFYSSMTRKITKAQRKPRKSKSKGKKN